jgi:hypothetical protein
MIVGQILQDDLARQRADKAQARRMVHALREVWAIRPLTTEDVLDVLQSEAGHRPSPKGWAERLRDAWRHWWARIVPKKIYR